MIPADLERIVAALHAHGCDYVLIGGAALNVHGIVRATEDIDLMLDPSPDNVARLRAALRSVWDDPSIDQITAEDLAGDYPAIRYGPPDEAIYLDIVARFGTAFAFADIERQSVSVGEADALVATPLALYRMKKDTVRPLDHVDAQALKQRFDLRDD